MHSSFKRISHVCVCVFRHVFVRERERDRRGCVSVSVCVFVCVCVCVSKRMKKESCFKGEASIADIWHHCLFSLHRAWTLPSFFVSASMVGLLHTHTRTHIHTHTHRLRWIWDRKHSERHLKWELWWHGPCLLHWQPALLASEVFVLLFVLVEVI